MAAMLLFRSYRFIKRSRRWCRGTSIDDGVRAGSYCEAFENSFHRVICEIDLDGGCAIGRFEGEALCSRKSVYVKVPFLILSVKPDFKAGHYCEGLCARP